MSYSRWSNSSWYSFWAESHSSKKDDQILSLWYSLSEDDCINFTYECLKTMDVISQLQGYYASELTLENIEEAKKLIEWFIEDVDEDFGDLSEEKIY